MVRRLAQYKIANGYVILKKHMVTATPKRRFGGGCLSYIKVRALFPPFVALLALAPRCVSRLPWQRPWVYRIKK